MGTYSGYAEYYPGYALTVEINVGSYSDPSHEADVLAERQRLMREALSSVGEQLGEAVAHYADGAHPYRRYVRLLDRGTRDYVGPAPESLWSSERRSRGAKLPLGLFKQPAPPADDVQLTPSASLSPSGPCLGPDQAIVLTLYLASDRVPYLVREVIDGHLVASQFAGGGLMADGGAAGDPSPAALQEALEDAHQGVNRHTLYRLLCAAVGQRSRLEAIAVGAEPASDSARLVAEVLDVFLAPSRFDPALAGRARQNRQVLTLLATLASDRLWAEHGDALRAMDDALSFL